MVYTYKKNDNTEVIEGVLKTMQLISDKIPLYLLVKVLQLCICH